MKIGEYNIYTVANDTMLPFLKLFCKSLNVQDPKLLKSLYVIPFNDDMDLTEQYCNENFIDIVKVDPAWDSIGEIIYKNEEYRTGIYAKNYFRKLNCFSHSKLDFVFFDVNSLVLNDFSSVLSCLNASCFEMLFMSRSAKGRTLRRDYLTSSINDLNDNIRTGFNAGFFASKPKTIDPNKALSIAQPNLRKLFGKAPEQAFISYYLAIFNVSCNKLSEADLSFQKGFWPNKFKVISVNGKYYYDEDINLERPLFVIKWTGQNYDSTRKSLNSNLHSMILDI